MAKNGMQIKQAVGDLAARLGISGMMRFGTPSIPRQPGGFRGGSNVFGTSGIDVTAGNQAAGPSAAGAGKYPSVETAVRNKL